MLSLTLVNVMIGRWSVPECTGTAPPPCAAFSFNKVDQQRALLFGGRQREARVNELHILNMDHWVCTIVTDTWATWVYPFSELKFFFFGQVSLNKSLMLFLHFIRVCNTSRVFSLLIL